MQWWHRGVAGEEKKTSQLFGLLGAEALYPKVEKERSQVPRSQREFEQLILVCGKRTSWHVGLEMAGTGRLTTADGKARRSFAWLVSRF